MKYNIVLWLLAFVFVSCDKEPDRPSTIETDGFKPTIKMLSPQNDAVFAVGDSIIFCGRASDMEDDFANLTIDWISNKDGTIGTSEANTTGEVSLTTDMLSLNEHSIVLKVTDLDGNISKDSVHIYNNLPKAVTLYEIEKDYNSIYLSWSKSTATDFASYKIYRSEQSGQGMNGELIATIETVEDTVYEDVDVIIGHHYYYQIFVENHSGIYIESNTEFISVGKYIQIAGSITRMMKHFTSTIPITQEYISIHYKIKKEEK